MFQVISSVLYVLSFDRSVIFFISYDLICSCSSLSGKPLPLTDYSLKDIQELKVAVPCVQVKSAKIVFEL